ncbi:MAG: radical SAM protein [Thermoplasmatales archaeon]|nr:radical SAM protein [Thermoplasmatales archaeon]
MEIVEHFRSLQGEGKTIGLPTYFVRAAGCNLDCAWCDTQYARGLGGEEMSPRQIVALVGDTKHVCVTGGEPLLQPDCAEVLDALVAAGKHVVLETNGSIDVSKVPDSDSITISMDVKCPKSGMCDRMLLGNIPRLRGKDQIKFVIFDGSDLDYAEGVIREYAPEAECIFSPVGGMDLEPLAEEILSRGLEARVLPQLHRIIWGNRESV